MRISISISPLPLHWDEVTHMIFTLENSLRIIGEYLQENSGSLLISHL